LDVLTEGTLLKERKERIHESQETNTENREEGEGENKTQDNGQAAKNVAPIKLFA
jgi:hypothetical protein